MCQHDLPAKDDRDPSQNSGRAGYEHRGRGGTDRGPGQGMGPVVAWMAYSWFVRQTVYCMISNSTRSATLEKPVLAKSTITGFLVVVM